MYGNSICRFTLKNDFDNGLVKNGYIKPEQARTATVTAVADTGAMYTVITEDLYQKLGLEKENDITVHIADGKQMTCTLTKAVRIEWKDRVFVSHAVVIPGTKKVLLGVLAMEGMDLMVDPTTQQLIGAHGDKPEFLALYNYFNIDKKWAG